MTEERWHLYVAPFNAETAQIALTERYSRAAATYVIIYRTNPETPEGYKEMTEDDLGLLPTEALKWLREVNVVIIQAFINEKMEEQERANRQFQEEFERQLQIEREKLLQQKE